MFKLFLRKLIVDIYMLAFTLFSSLHQQSKVSRRWFFFIATRMLTLSMFDLRPDLLCLLLALCQKWRAAGSCCGLWGGFRCHQYYSESAATRKRIGHLQGNLCQLITWRFTLDNCLKKILNKIQYKWICIIFLRKEVFIILLWQKINSKTHILV